MKQNEIFDALEIRYVDLKFTVAFNENCRISKYKTSALRGGMGQMLLQQNCIRDKDCKICDFSDECLVRRMMYSKYEIQPRFATQGDSMGYVIECNNLKERFRRGDELTFHLLLYGKVIAHFSPFLPAFYMLGQYGLGCYGAKYQIVKVENEKGELVVDDNNVYLQNLDIRTIREYVDERILEIERGCCANTMIFYTPTTIKYQGDFIKKFHAEAIFRSVLRRIYSFDCFEGNQIPLLELDEMLPEIIDQEVSFVKVPRYSSTMQDTMELKGIQGKVIFDKLTENLLTVLLAGEKLHIGKNTSFGFGKYRID